MMMEAAVAYLLFAWRMELFIDSELTTPFLLPAATAEHGSLPHQPILALVMAMLWRLVLVSLFRILNLCNSIPRAFMVLVV
mmetsp:Transcript_10361/g.34549  ORF Transcript_10361/g.34549 Transcript_10361/m.34549 type:complete len:81 (+) Transcript_10361:696-938(+)